jgi:putative pyoverdin transport system ATP-binding/permease protein
MLVAIILTGLTGGLVSTGLLALINSTLSHPKSAPSKLGWSFLGLCLLLPVARFISQWLLVHLAQTNTYDLRMRLSRAVLSAPLRDLEKLGAARILATMTDDVQSLSAALSGIPVFFLHITVVVSCLIYMGWLSWPLLLIILGAVVIGLPSYQMPLSGALRHFRLSRQKWDDLFEHFRGLTQGTKELKIHRARRRAFLSQQLEPTAASIRHHNIVGSTIHALANTWGQIMFFILIGLILYVVPKFSTVEQSILTGFTLTILYMLAPFDMVLNQFPLLARAAVAMENVEALGLKLVPAAGESDRLEPPSATPPWRSLELAGVAHTFYREDVEDNFTLGPLDLVFRPGELVFIIGGNGSGKTTLAKMLTGLYLPEAGRIKLDGEPVNVHNADAYRQLFSVVFSDFYLFNVLLGLNDPHLDENALKYLKRLHLDRVVKVGNGILSTTNLSQGQRKRLALLTAYLEDRSIYVFDEWAADQDPQFKDIFYLQLLPELKRRGKTVFIVSHDDSYYAVADRIVKLDYGQVNYEGDAQEYLEFLRTARLLTAREGTMV